LKIILVIHALPGGGTGRVLTYMANYWARAGHRVTILTLEKSDSPSYFLADSVEWIALNLACDSAAFVEGMLRNLRRIYLIRKAIKKTVPDCIISFVYSTNVLVLLATRFLNCPLIISERNHPDYAGKTRLTWYWLRQILYPLAGHLVVQTREIKVWFKDYNKSLHIIRNPVMITSENIEVEPEIKLPSGKRIVAMGQLSPQKGFDLLLQVFARIHKSHQDWKLIILGTGQLLDELKQMSIRLGIDKSVHIPGRVENPFSIFLRCDLFVLSSRYEGFPNALLEAMACGLPVISYDCHSGPGEMIKDNVNGLLVPPNDLDDLEDAIKRLINDDKLRASLGREAMKVQDRFSLEKVMGQWNDLLPKCSLIK
jgi:glycosyltransferase involved in cell wall biosynthesis